MESDYDLVIVGAGIVGLSTAMWASFLFPRMRIAVLEKESHIAGHQTSHNSGVVHSGIYYRPGSEKAKLCVLGAAAMQDFCRHRGVPIETCGKVVVATSEEQLPGLKELYSRGVQNGVPGITMIGPERLREIEPNARGITALHVPGAGITNYSEVAREYAEIASESGVQIQTGTELLALRGSSNEFVLETTAGNLHSKFLINCAGLHSDRVAAMTGARLDLKIVPFRGEYYELVPARRYLVKNLIYPVADPRFPFLGVHFTRHVNGSIEAGPNAVLALKREGYSWSAFKVSDALDIALFSGTWKMAGRYWQSGLQEMYRSLSKSAFVRSLQQLVPEVRENDFVDGGSGVRAQAVNSKGALLDDFCFVQGHRILHVCNVPSPAATASLMIGRKIAEIAAKQLDKDPPSLSGRPDTFLSKWRANSSLP
jgi:L-2-hydroxyglutarate oxidase LhgO